MSNYTVLKRYDANEVISDEPVSPISVQEVLNTENNKHYLEFKFLNNSGKQLTSFEFVIVDASGRQLAVTLNHLSVNPGEYFGKNSLIAIPSDFMFNTVITKNVEFADDDEAPKKKRGWLVIVIVLILALAAFLVWNFFIKHDCERDGHEYGEWVVTAEATCINTGEKYKECKYCGDKTTVTLDKVDHTYNGNTCTVCGYQKISMTPLFNATTLAELHVRTGPGLTYSVSRNLAYGSSVTVYETKQADGYTWNRINESEWIANDGTWLQK